MRGFLGLDQEREFSLPSESQNPTTKSKRLKVPQEFQFLSPLFRIFFYIIFLWSIIIILFFIFFNICIIFLMYIVLKWLFVLEHSHMHQTFIFFEKIKIFIRLEIISTTNEFCAHKNSFFSCRLTHDFTPFDEFTSHLAISDRFTCRSSCLTTRTLLPTSFRTWTGASNYYFMYLASFSFLRR